MQLVSFVAGRAGPPTLSEEESRLTREAMAGLHAETAVVYAKRFGSDSIAFLSIESTETQVAAFGYYQEDGVLQTIESLRKRMLVLLTMFAAAGRNNTSVANYAQVASRLAVEITSLSQPEADNGTFLRTASTMLEEGIAEAQKLIAENSDAIAAVKQALLDKNSLTAEEITALMG